MAVDVLHLGDGDCCFPVAAISKNNEVCKLVEVSQSEVDGRIMREEVNKLKQRSEELKKQK